MRAGRVPVIISDEWLPPSRIDWNSFSVRVPEQDVHRLPSLLREYEAQAQAMGELARHVWVKTLASTAVFNYIGDVLSDISTACDADSESYLQRSRFLDLLRQPSHALPFMKEKLKDLIMYSSAISK
jgi:hypothetical protein